MLICTRKNVKIWNSSKILGQIWRLLIKKLGKKLGRSTMIKSTKIVKSVTGEKIEFEGEFITNATFNGKTLKLTSFVLKNTNNLFGTDWRTQFQLCDLPVNSYCQKIENLSTKAEKLKEEVKVADPEFFLVV